MVLRLIEFRTGAVVSLRTPQISARMSIQKIEGSPNRGAGRQAQSERCGERRASSLQFHDDRSRRQ